MHTSSLQIIETIKKSRTNYTEEEILNFFDDIRTSKNDDLIQKFRKPKKKPKPPVDPVYTEFNQERKKLKSIPNAAYIEGFTKWLKSKNVIHKFEPTATQSKSIPPFYKAITKQIPPEHLVSLAKDYTRKAATAGL